MSPSTSSRFRLKRDKADTSASSSRPASAPGQKAQKAPGRVAQVRQGYEFAKQVDPKITQWMLGAAAIVLLVFLLIGFLLHQPILWLLVGIPVAAMAAAIVMARRADRGAYSMIEGKPGAALAALTSIRRGGWYIPQEPMAMEGRPHGQDFSTVATVYRAVGRPGVVLVGEGPTNRTKKLLAAEQKKVERLAPGAPVHIMRVGEGEDTIQARKLSWAVQKLKPVLTKDEVTTVEKRLKAMTGIRPGIPGGMDPTRARSSRAALRGR